ncbi:hypothetical protein LOZ57_000816 [Ophidiomyces ophidiicola]|uniref:uncharacterized protein n=1 Tax=Ophidiomyces ophidiicola TaxID=1387563 RepID=UPI0020C57C3B|nr:uncharacterized protein LOZ57_000816 [Ophidiomyces ophidiicola]KAI1952736.1 hypothetical protein LOZ57_000816 [Ophidiomyces ophidiicola]KAI2060844.1 hypothetical protein LOZ43_001491 [Ophidiomyces ophidiicola]KAI2092566.1 hypothetical protein LOZ36_000445 [Ophidiomyces ophidiicola]
MDQNYNASSVVEVQPVPQPPLKFSRYRSVRKAAAASAAPPLPPLPAASAHDLSGLAKTQSNHNNNNESIQRSMSRYRHAKPARIITSIPPPPVPQIPVSPHQTKSRIEDWVESTRVSQDIPRLDDLSLEQQDRNDLRSPSLRGIPSQSLSQPSSPRFRGFSRILGRASFDRRREKEDCISPTSLGHHHHRLSYSAGHDANTQSKSLRRRPENIATPQSPLQQENTTDEETPLMDVKQLTLNEQLANERAAALHNGHSSNKKLVKGRGGFLSLFKGIDTSGSSRAQRDAREGLKNKISSPTLIEPKDLPSVLPDDTPVSAVNAGERKVLVTCNEAFVTLPITPSTKAQELLHSAFACLKENIDPKTAVLVESFKQLGLERPLRRYEHVRDVMNSWDSDEQNHFEIVPSSEGEEDDEALDIRFAPRKQPKDATFHIYHSHRAGKWDKRYITLRSDGRVLMAKKPGAEPTSICHMSDFDIYRLKSREYRRVKPPKRYCYVIKSQQKANLFVAGGNFAHSFSIGDTETAQAWYRSVQEWRSWYLVSIMGDSSDCSPDLHASAGVRTSFHSNRFSIDSIPCQPNGFRPMNSAAQAVPSKPPTPPDEAHPQTRRPLILGATSNNDYFNTPLPTAPSSPKRSLMHMERKPTVKRERSQTVSSRHQQQQPPAESEPFEPTGLLGRTYTLRQHAMREREREKEEEAEQLNPFTAHGLLSHLDMPTRSAERPIHTSSGPPSRASTVRSPPGHRPRSSIQQQQLPKPLVDLTPTYQEAPQHTRKGRGITAPSGTPLIDIATGPDLCPGAIAVPSATTWRKPMQRSGTMSSQTTRVPEPTTFAPPVPRDRQRSYTMRGTTSSYPRPLSANSPASLESPFIPTGLLAQAKVGHAQGSAETGRGVATGSRHGSRPLLDMTEPSCFADGSLLRTVEQTGAGEDCRPVIDREKRD